MISVCIYFQVHQPYRLRRDYGFFDIEHDHSYFEEDLNREIVESVAQKCYLPANRILLREIKRHRGRFRIAFSISGCALEQFETYAPEVIESFKELVDTGCVELINETYHHSLAYLYDRDEFILQINQHRELLKRLFNFEPTCFRNTELIYDDKLAAEVEKLGYQVILAEGANQVLGWNSPNYLYQPADTEDLKLLLRNHQLSDDISFRFCNEHGRARHLPSEFAQRLFEEGNNGEVVNLFMDYETFGEHYPEQTGILNFLKELPAAALARPNIYFQTPTEVAQTFQPVSHIGVPYPVSWADVERDLTAWVGNPMQDAAIEDLYRLGKQILHTADSELIQDWRRLQTSDHFYYMCTKWFSDGDVHKHFNPFATPHDAFRVYSNILNDLRHRLAPGPK